VEVAVARQDFVSHTLLHLPLGRIVIGVDGRNKGALRAESWQLLLALDVVKLSLGINCPAGLGLVTRLGLGDPVKLALWRGLFVLLVTKSRAERGLEVGLLWVPKFLVQRLARRTAGFKGAGMGDEDGGRSIIFGPLVVSADCFS
jgi:hypothetical protein